MISLAIRPFGTSHGRHDGAQAKITAVRGDTRSEPCFWVCTCGASCSFLTEDGVLATAWRHNPPHALRPAAAVGHPPPPVPSARRGGGNGGRGGPGAAAGIPQPS
ncbi:hypothetical protein ALMP_12570 [Streptomyces sp. A012304]|nr:hypothetical protein ALMP_12570 [Streptomyces sp. A012304]